MSLSNCSFDLRPRPPETTLVAVARSGRSDFWRSSDIHSVELSAFGSTPSAISAEPPSASAGGNAVPRVVMILIESDDWQVRIAFPAYIGRTKAESRQERNMITKLKSGKLTVLALNSSNVRDLLRI